MPEQKDLKRLVRARMEKTGESYTAARGQIVKQKKLPSDEQLAELAGMANDKVEARTGRTWRQWVRALDGIGALSMEHRDIARRVHEEYGVPGWWSQTVTVGYERIRGLREKGQRRDTGTFDANKSRTFAVPVARVYRAFAHGPTRERWLPKTTFKVRTSIENKSMRVTWHDGTSVLLYFTPTETGKTQLAIQHTGLPERKDVAASKEYWTEKLDALQTVLGET